MPCGGIYVEEHFNYVARAGMTDPIYALHGSLELLLTNAISFNIYPMHLQWTKEERKKKEIFLLQWKK